MLSSFIYNSNYYLIWVVVEEKKMWKHLKKIFSGHKYIQGTLILSSFICICICLLTHPFKWDICHATLKSIDPTQLIKEVKVMYILLM